MYAAVLWYVSHAQHNRFMHALHGNGDSGARAEAPRRRPVRSRLPPVDFWDAGAQAAVAPTGRRQPLTCDQVMPDRWGVQRRLATLRWGQHVMSYDGTNLVPVGVDGLTSLSYIMCPLIADAIGAPEWFPEEMAPRPLRLGVAARPGGGLVPNPSVGATWADAVAEVRERVRADLGDQFREAAADRLDMRLHFTRRDQERWVADEQQPQNHEALRP